MSMYKERVTITLSAEARYRLKQIARENHTTMSAWIEQEIWATRVEHPEEIGQVRFDEI